MNPFTQQVQPSLNDSVTSSLRFVLLVPLRGNSTAGFRIIRRAANELQEQLVRSATTTLRDKLDRLVVQFKEANPTFYEEYYAARVIVDSRGGNSSNTDVQPTPLVTPTPTPVIA
jgi:hypothetical protein